MEIIKIYIPLRKGFLYIEKGKIKNKKKVKPFKTNEVVKAITQQKKSFFFETETLNCILR